MSPLCLTVFHYIPLYFTVPHCISLYCTTFHCVLSVDTLRLPIAPLKWSTFTGSKNPSPSRLISGFVFSAFISQWAWGNDYFYCVLITCVFVRQALGVMLYKLSYFTLPFGESPLAIQNCNLQFPSTPGYSKHLTGLIRNDFFLAFLSCLCPSCHFCSHRLLLKSESGREARDLSGRCAHLLAPQSWLPCS